MRDILVEGHRGFSAKYPENTLLSFRAAMELGVDVIEFDVWLTSDKEPVIMHDGSPLRTCGVFGHLRDMTLCEVKSTLEPAYTEKFGDKYKGLGLTVPTLRELLELCRDEFPSIRLGVELKEYTEENADITIDLLKEYGFFDRCWIYCFNSRILKYCKTKYGICTMGYPDFKMKEFESDTYSYYSEIGLSIEVVKSEVLPIYKAKGMPIHMYCADNTEDAQRFIDEGASLITGNDPTYILRLLGRL